MTAADRLALHRLAEALPAGSAVPVPREWLLELLEGADPAPVSPTRGETPGDRLLTAHEVAARLGTSREWVYRQARRWPFTRRVARRALRFSEAGFARWVERRTRPGRAA